MQTQIIQIKVFLVCLTTLTLTTCVSAHSFMLQPRPYNRQYTTVVCDVQECGLACPQYLPNSANNTPSSPEATWSRGQRVNVTWARNNHHGGFISFMLVPMDSALSNLMNTALHDSLAFNHGCWEQGNFICAEGVFCGSSQQGHALSRIITVPPVYPDGIYIFSLVWYGGLHFERRYGHFPDYRSCAFIRIQGGISTTRKFQPFFDPGRNEKKIQGDWCESAAAAPGVCPYTGCRGPEYPMFTGKPLVFANGARPPPIYRNVLQRLLQGSDPPNPTVSPRPTSTSTPTASPSSLPIPSKTPTSTPTPSSPSSSPSKYPLSSPLAEALCVVHNGYRVCCHQDCSVCQQRRCRSRQGGARKCCPETILKKGRSCDTNNPPCLAQS